LNENEIIVEKFDKQKNQLIRYTGKSGYGILELTDIREEIKNNEIPTKAIKIV